MAVFLSNTIVPKMVEDFSSLTSSPIDGIALTEVMHSRGINMRYLGKVARLCQEKKDMEYVLVSETSYFSRSLSFFVVIKGTVCRNKTLCEENHQVAS